MNGSNMRKVQTSSTNPTPKLTPTKIKISNTFPRKDFSKTFTPPPRSWKDMWGGGSGWHATIYINTICHVLTVAVCITLNNSLRSKFTVQCLFFLKITHL